MFGQWSGDNTSGVMITDQTMPTLRMASNWAKKGVPRRTTAVATKLAAQRIAEPMMYCARLVSLLLIPQRHGPPFVGARKAALQTRSARAPIVPSRP